MRYQVTAHVAGGKSLGEVEADSPEEATRKGWELDTANISLCHQCSEQCEDPEIQEILVSEIK